MLWVRISFRARWTTLCDQVCQWLATGRWFSLGPPVSSTNKSDHHDIYLSVTGCPHAALLSNGDGPVWVAAGCPWADILHNGDWPVWVQPYFLRLTCCLMTMDLHECGSHGPLREDRENEIDISRLWQWYQHLQTWTLNKRWGKESYIYSVTNTCRHGLLIQL